MTLLSDAEFLEAVLSFRHTAFRLELQRTYAEPHEDAQFAAFLLGDPQPGPDDPELRRWYASVAEHTADGGRIGRVRVHEDPPNDYQRFLRHLDRWNIGAGEVMRYMTREQAHEVGLLPAAGDLEWWVSHLPTVRAQETRLLPVTGDVDWWLIDSASLIAMFFDRSGHRVSTVLTTNPEAVLQACMWRDLAVHHSVQHHSSDAAA